MQFSVKPRYACQKTSKLLENVRALNSNSKQTTGRINLKLTRVTPAGLEGFEELSTAYKFLVSEAPSQKDLKIKDPHIS